MIKQIFWRQHFSLCQCIKRTLVDSSLHCSTIGFSKSANLYEASRPHYLPQAIDFLLDHCNLHPLKSNVSKIHIVEVGAGTGIFTQCLSDFFVQHAKRMDGPLNVRITAIEPIKEMYEKIIHKELSKKWITKNGSLMEINVIPQQGTALKLPKIEDESVDAIFCAQSFHWFATREVLQQFNQVLKRDGHLGLIWNQTDISIDFVNQIETLCEKYNTEGVVRSVMSDKWKDAFIGQEWFHLKASNEYKFEQTGELSKLVDRFMSISFIAKLEESMKKQVRNQIENILNNKWKNGNCKLPYNEQVFVYKKQ